MAWLNEGLRPSANDPYNVKFGITNKSPFVSINERLVLP
jgi:hypothetical protein